MPRRPDLISQEYITPVSVTTSAFGGSRSNNGTIRSEMVYSDLRPKPLSCRRKRFIVTNVVFVVVQLCALLALVLSMTLRHPMKRGRSTGSNHGCELCDLWCTSNCSHLTLDGDDGLTLKVINVNETREGKDRTELCCVKRKDTLSINYEKQKSTSGGSYGSPREKSFDGIRLKDKWVEDSNWPTCSSSALTFRKKERRFLVTSDGTFFVHSRIDFTCLRNNFSRQQLEIDSRTSDDSVFIDERAQLGQSISTKNGTVVYTSTINVIAKLKIGDSLKFVTDPNNCSFPRTLVVFQSKDVL